MASRFEDPEIALPGQAYWEEPVKVTGHALKACNTRKVMPSSLDLDGDGVINVAEATAARNQISFLRKGFCAVLVVLGVQQLLMFGTVYWATQLAAEVHVSNSELRDDNGQQVSTLQRRDRIEGLHYPTTRRLSASARRLNVTESDTSESAVNATESDFGNVTAPGNMTVSDGSESGNLTYMEDSIGFHGSMEISQDYFQSTWHGYMSGESDWVVPFPDGSVRTVFIQGMGADYAWGLCGACPGGNVQWQATCPSADSAEECSVYYEQVFGSPSMSRRRLAGSEEAIATPLLARARAQPQNPQGADAEPGVERSLGGKHCV
jgi:hypothetical protein